MKPPRIPSVFRLGKYGQNKQFHYEPRTFDQRKEDLEKRRRIIEQELEMEQKLGKNHEALLRESMHESWARRETRRQQRNSGRRLLLILAVLVLILYFVYLKLDLTL